MLKIFSTIAVASVMTLGLTTSVFANDAIESNAEQRQQVVSQSVDQERFVTHRLRGLKNIPYYRSKSNEVNAPRQIQESVALGQAGRFTTRRIKALKNVPQYRGPVSSDVTTFDGQQIQGIGGGSSAAASSTPAAEREAAVKARKNIRFHRN